MSQADSGPEFAELIENATMGDAHDSSDSALQYVSFDMADAGYDSDAQREQLDDVAEKIEKVANHAFADGVTVAAKRGETAAAKYVIEQIEQELGDSAVEQRFIERLHQKKGNIAIMYDSALTLAKRRAEQELREAVVDWGPVVA